MCILVQAFKNRLPYQDCRSSGIVYSETRRSSPYGSMAFENAHTQYPLLCQENPPNPITPGSSLGSLFSDRQIFFFFLPFLKLHLKGIVKRKFPTDDLQIHLPDRVGFCPAIHESRNIQSGRLESSFAELYEARDCFLLRYDWQVTYQFQGYNTMSQYLYIL